MCVLSHFSHVQLFVTSWTSACQAPLSVGFSGQEYWSVLPCPPTGDLPNLGIGSHVSCIDRQVLYLWHHLGSHFYTSPKLLIYHYPPPPTAFLCWSTLLTSANTYTVDQRNRWKCKWSQKAWKRSSSSKVILQSNAPSLPPWHCPLSCVPNSWCASWHRGQRPFPGTLTPEGG